MKILLLVLILLTLTPAFAQDETTLTGHLDSESSEQRYPYQAKKGQILNLYLKSFDFDPFLVLEDAHGNEIASNDDSTRSLNSAISYVTWDDSEYTIVVRSTAGAGDYELEIETVALPRLEYSQNMTGILTPADTVDIYYFEGSAGEVVTLTANSDPNLAYLSLELKQPSFEYLINATGSQGRVLLGPFTLPYTGVYPVMVRTDRPESDKAYLLRMERTPMTPIESTITGAFTAGNQILVYSFEGTGMERITARVESDMLTGLALYNMASGHEIIYTTEAGIGHQPEIYDLLLPGDSAYVLVVRPVIPGETGTFSLTFSKDPVRSLSEGSQRIMLSNMPREEVLSFEPAAPGDYLLTIDLAPNILNPGFRISILQDGESLASMTSLELSEAGHADLPLTFPSTSPVKIKFENLGNRLLVLDVVIKRS